jgi:hypothetical protein
MHTDIDMGGSSMGRGGFSHCISMERSESEDGEEKKRRGRGSDPLQFPTLCQAPTQNGMLMFLKVKHIY